ncbi:MarR family transcriptional regulator [Vibrio nigripulchritudo]|uniref:MarR family winged helix-turn-helix transcriptional regulator n=1 Tax=Vibrio nigripulchritudo TaxID=28173 RepID=UPI00190C972E|nr:MarR family transcriptional regulator [Vibrio nigripulchritudo]BCL72139.1 MarR family transcriptional regulator [Vibrio nigripulchritudo]BDU33497.1 MarR family transcriptional regulator [Vibrio nigripulchritudo]
MNEKDYISNLFGAFATTIATRIEEEVLELGGRSLTHESALVAIQNHPNDTIDVLRKVLGITHSGAVRLINTLEKEGLVERYRSEVDARAVVLRVTDKGSKRAEQVLKARERVTDQVFAHLNSQQQDAIVSALEVSLSALTNDQESARRICRLCNEQVCRAKGCPVELKVLSQ